MLHTGQWRHGMEMGKFRPWRVRTGEAGGRAREKELLRTRPWARRCLPLLMAAVVPAVGSTLSPARAAVAEPQFGPYEEYPGGAPHSVAIADFTGDGRKDVVANSGDARDPEDDFKLLLYSQDATGRLQRQANLDITPQSGPYQLTTVAAGDLDGDRRADVAVGTARGVDLFFQRDGTLGGRVSIVLEGTRQVEIADVDGDGRADVVTSGGGGVSWLPGAGDGTFGSPVSITDGVQAEIEVADVSGDGRPDVVGYQWADATIHVFRQRSDGSFITLDHAAVGTNGLAAGDVTGDGRVDVVASVNGNRPQSGLLVLPQRPDGTLGPAVVRDSYDLPGPVQVGDLNGDGRLDVAVLHAGWWRAGVYAQEADGALSAERLFRIPYGNYAKKALDLGDVTGDGRPDLVWAEWGRIVVLPGLPPLAPTTTAPTTSVPAPTTSAPASTTTTASTTVPPSLPPPPADSTTSYQIDASHTGSLSGGDERPPLERRWSRDLRGTVSYPLVAEGKVFALARTETRSQGSTLYAVDARTGRDVWGPVDLGSDAHYAYGDGQVFVLNADGVIRSFDAATGRLRWIVRRNLKSDSPPVYRGGALYFHARVSYGGELHAVSAADGRELAVVPINDGGASAPAVSEGLVYSSHQCTPATARDPRSLAMAWSYGWLCYGGSANYTPVVGADLLWVRGISGRLPTALDARTGAKVVTFTADAPPAFDGGLGYFLHRGALEARDPRSQLPRWSFTGDGRLTVAPIVVNGFVYAASASGQVWALDGSTGEVVWTDNAGAPVLAPGEVDLDPALVGLAAGQGVVAVPASNLLVAYGPEGRAPLGVQAAAGLDAETSDRGATASAAVSPSAPPSDVGNVGIDAAHRGRVTGGNERAPWRKRWTRDLGYPAQYSLLAENKVFVAAGPNLFALDAATGKDVWPPITLGPPEPNPHSFVAYGDGRLFAAFREGPLRAFDAATGRQLWSKEFQPFEVLGSPPVYSEGLVYTVSSSSGLRALSASTGRQVWSGHAGGGGFSMPPTVEGGRAFAVAACNSVFAYHSLTGAGLWRSPGACTGGTSLGSAVAAGRVWAEGDGRDTPLIFDAATGKLTGAFSGSLPAFDDERAYVLDGSALKARDIVSQFTRWTFLGDGQLTTPPVLVNGHVYVGSASGRVWALDPATGSPVWEDDAGTPIARRATPLSAGVGTNIAAGQGVMVVPASTRVVVYEPVTPVPATASRPLAWGWNAQGQLGDGTTVDRSRPAAFGRVTDAVDVGAGTFHSLSVRPDGTVWGSGWNALGQLGDGTTVSRTSPVQVRGVSGVVAVTAGAYHSIALKSDGTVWAWGWNGFGQLGDGTITQRLTPVRVATLSDVVSIGAGALHNVAVKKDGTVWAWGWNGLGQLGDGGSADRHVPVRVPGLVDVVGVGSGFHHSLAVKRDGTVLAWGWNALGQLGDGSTIDRRTPRAVAGVADATSVTGGLYHSLAVHDDGTVSSWGWNALGQLGDGTLVDRRRPVKVAGLRGVTDVAAGFFHTLARREDGTVTAWGWNGFGQLGDGTTALRLIPHVVPGVHRVAAGASGAYHTVVT